jgi:hypothetical protein
VGEEERHSRGFSTANAILVLPSIEVEGKFNKSTAKCRGRKAPMPSKMRRRKQMGLLEELAGAAVAVEGAKKLDPGAGILTEGAAALAGFEGTKEITNLIDKKEDENSGQQG